jgi:hypothetical protein
MRARAPMQCNSCHRVPDFIPHRPLPLVVVVNVVSLPNAAREGAKQKEDAGEEEKPGHEVGRLHRLLGIQRDERARRKVLQREHGCCRTEGFAGVELCSGRICRLTLDSGRRAAARPAFAVVPPAAN